MELAGTAMADSMQVRHRVPLLTSAGEFWDHGVEGIFTFFQTSNAKLLH